MRSSEALHEQLSDATSRGRLCLGEGCGFTRAELDALCELGAEKLEMGLIQEAITLLRGLVALYPYSSKYYLCLGIALMQANQFEAAASSLALATTLTPDDLTILIHLCEAHLRAGQFLEAQTRALEIQDTADIPESLRHRWELVQACIARLQTSEKPMLVPEQKGAESNRPPVKPQTTFKLPSGKTLPLEKSSYEVTQPWVPVPTSEATQTDIPVMTFDESVTITAVVRRRRPEKRSSRGEKEVTQTAVIVRRNIGRKTSENQEDTAVSYFSDLNEEN